MTQSAILKNPPQISNCAEQQADLQSLVEWSEKWQLQINTDKCKVLHLERNNGRVIYKMGDTELQSTKFEKDLGVCVDEDLKFQRHISFAVNKSSTMLWLIKKTFSGLHEDTLPRLYKVLVKPTWNMETLFGIHTIRWTNWQWKRFSGEQQTESYT